MINLIEFRVKDLDSRHRMWFIFDNQIIEYKIIINLHKLLAF